MSRVVGGYLLEERIEFLAPLQHIEAIQVFYSLLCVSSICILLKQTSDSFLADIGNDKRPGHSVSARLIDCDCTINVESRLRLLFQTRLYITVLEMDKMLFL